MATITIRNDTAKRTRHSTLSNALEVLFEVYNLPSAKVDVLLTDNRTMKRLNKEFRGIDEATDVLTFPAPDWDGAPLGDIAISLDFATRGAAAMRVPVHEELAYLGIHGGLHLLGYDDETEQEREDMVDRMNVVAARAGIKTDENWASQPHNPEQVNG